MRRGAKHTLCRRLGNCIWGNPKCPSARRPYSAGQHGSTKRRGKLSTYGELLLEKQKLRAFYALNERQLQFAYKQASRGGGATGDKLLRNLEMRLASAVYRSGLAPTVAAARQAVSHRHVLVNGKVVDRAGYRLKAGQVITISSEASPALAAIAQKTDVVPPPYLEVEKDKARVTVAREPLLEEIHANVEITRVVEYYAR